MASLDQAKLQMLAAGMPPFPVGHPKVIGKVQRYGPKKNAWYVLREYRLRNGQEVVVGAFGVWGRMDTITIEADWSGVSEDERAEVERRIKEAREKEAEKTAEEQRLAANRARDQWSKAAQTGNSPYAARKQITAPAVRYFADGTMLVPMFIFDGDTPRLVGLQKIAPDGQKRFNKGIEMNGACLPLGKVSEADPVLFVEEGYATGRTIRMGSDDSIPGYVGFTAGNLIHVARMARRRHPNAHILICADDDYQIHERLKRDLVERFEIVTELPVDGKVHVLPGKEGEYRCCARLAHDENNVCFLELQISSGGWSRKMRYENAGLAKAMAAAAEVGNASVIWPTFRDRGENKWTDFNDLHCAEGLDAVRQQLRAAIDSILNPAPPSPEPELPASGPDQSSNVVPLKGGKKKKPAAKSAAAGEEEVVASNSRESSPMDSEVENSEIRWESRLVRTEKGGILPVLCNVYDILKNHDDWQGVIAYEEFSGHVVKLKPPPYDRGRAGEWTDMDDLHTALWVQKTYGFYPREEAVMKAVLLVADLHTHHVVRAYLDPLKWDGTERLSHWIVDMLGAIDCEYVRRVARKWLIGAVARIYEPGCKVDNVLILEGTQGLYKSTALKVLFGEWFTDAPLRFGDKDSYVIMRGKWVIELAELDSFNKAESEQAKQFFGQFVDRYRNFYGKRASDVPRQQVFAGSTNKYVYLKDETGNRRYWPVRCLEVNLEALRAARDQLWAEAVVAYRAGEPHWTTPDDIDLFAEQQDERFVDDAYLDLVAEGLIGRTRTTTSEILGDILKLDVAKWTMPEQQRVGRCLSQLGWIRRKGPKVAGGKRPYFYEKPGASTGALGQGLENGADDGPL